MVATACARSVGVSCWAGSRRGGARATPTRHARRVERVVTRLMYLLLFGAPQLLLWLYLRDRLPDPTRPRRGRVVRAPPTEAFLALHFPLPPVGPLLPPGTPWRLVRATFT